MKNERAINSIVHINNIYQQSITNIRKSLFLEKKKKSLQHAPTEAKKMSKLAQQCLNLVRYKRRN